MTTQYTVFNWKEYVSLRKYWNMQQKCAKLEKENKELKEENENLTEELTRIWMLYKNVMRIN